MNNNFKITLAAARVNADFTQKEVAKTLKISKTTLINWEKSKVKLKPTQLIALCELYKINLDNIFLPIKYTESGVEAGKETERSNNNEKRN